MTQTTLTAGELRNTYELIVSLIVNQQTGETRRWPAKFSYWLSRMTTKLKAEYETSEAARLALAEQHGVKSEDGKQYVFNAEGGAQFTEGYNAILATVIELDLPTVRVDSLENVEIEPAALVALDKFIVE